MEHTFEKLSGNKVKISFKVPADEFGAAINKAYLKMRGQIVVPGFRKGKAPRKLMEKMYGEGIFCQEAFEDMFPDLYMTALKESDIKPVTRPELTEVPELAEGKELAFACEVFVVPDVTLGTVKGIKVTRETRKITEEEVDSRIEQERKRVARSVEVTDRPLENDDNAELDYCGTVDGVAFEGGTAEHQHLVIGSGSFIPGFEEQMIGMNIGEERDLNVKFPDEYHSEELKGKDAVFHVKLHAITREELPELDDEFAAEVSDFDTLADYRADLTKKMQEAADEEATQDTRSNMVDAIVEEATVDIPAPMVEDKLDEMMEEMSWRMQQQGFTMDMYLKMLGQTKSEMREMYRTEATRRVKTELVMDEVIKTEGIEATEEEVDAEIKQYADAVGDTLESVKAKFGPEQLDYFRKHAQTTKTLDMLWDNAEITDAEENAEA